MTKSLPEQQIMKNLQREVFLQTAIIPLEINGDIIHVRGVLDSASQNNLITEAAVQRLQIRRQKQTTRICGVGGNEVCDNKGQFHLLIRSSNNELITITASILQKLTNHFPSRRINIDNWTTVKELQLADPGFNYPQEIDMIIGAAHYEDLMIGNNRIKEQTCSIYYRLSVFGWLVNGQQNSKNVYASLQQTFFVSDESNTNLQRFWEIEEVPEKKLWTPEELKCEEHFKATTKRRPDGRFVVKLPFKEEIGLLGDSLQQARRRLRSLLYRLERNPELYKKYNNFINEFLNLGHMEVIPDNELVRPHYNCFYIPHHCVFKDSSTATKLRVFFDASAKTTSGISLNDKLMVGPTVQKDLFSILIRFRMHQVALSADIAKMYRQVELEEEDRDYHRILWKHQNSTEVRHYRMTRVTYGIASSAFHSIRPLQVLAEESDDDSFRIATLNDMYIDDLLSGSSDTESAIQLQDGFINTLGKAGFEIRKWTSNDTKLVERLPVHYREAADEITIKVTSMSSKHLDSNGTQCQIILVLPLN